MVTSQEITSLSTLMAGRSEYLFGCNEYAYVKEPTTRLVLLHFAGPPGLEPGTALLERAILPLDDRPVATTLPY